MSLAVVLAIAGWVVVAFDLLHIKCLEDANREQRKQLDAQRLRIRFLEKKTGRRSEAA